MVRLKFAVFLCLAAVASSPGAENPVLWGTVRSITSDAWKITGFDSTFELTESGLSGEFRIARVTLTESGETFDEISITCALLGMTTRGVNCAQATFTATIPGVGRQTVPGAFEYDRQTSTANIELTDVVIASGNVRVNITATEAGIELGYTGTELQLGGLFALASTFNDTFAEYSADGRADVSGTLSVPGDGPMRSILSADLAQASLANDAGTIAAAGVQGKLDLDVSFGTSASTVALTFDSSQGEAYLEPVYANFSEHPLNLRAEEIVTSDYAHFEVGRFRLQQASLLDVAGSVTLGFPQEDNEPIGVSADVEFRDSSINNLYTSLLQVQLAGTVLGDLDTDGRISGSVSIGDNSPLSATLQLDDVILDDRGGRFAVYGLHGAVDWRADETQVPATSQLRWDSGTVYDIIIGGGAMNMQLGDNDIELLAPLRLPTMGGALVINELLLRNFGNDDASGKLDAELEPIQLGQLTGTFGWPAFSGALSGRLPLMQLAENVVTVGGTLSAKAFDGTMEMSKLRIEQPFGLVPRMQGDVAFRNLDLQRLTEVFSFGLIQGRLSGDIAGLEMQNWSPVAMDMHFYTPPDDKSRHRISQRAVENLASVGGGGAAAILSTGFLQFFDVFSYDRIGLRCLLQNGTCAMSGAGATKEGPQGRGFYIVKGSGVPRINVVGYRDKVSWARLAQQLAAITSSGAPTVN